MANTIGFDQWKNLCATASVQSVSIGAEGSIHVDVLQRIPCTARERLIRSVADSCVKDGNFVPELLQPIFRISVIAAYTNIDVKGASLDNMWALACNELVWYPIVEAIKDDINEMYDCVDRICQQQESKIDMLAGEVLRIFNEIKAVLPENIMDELKDIVDKSIELKAAENN